MKLNMLSAQISVFMSDGLANPSKFTEKIYNNFNKVFTVENLLLNIPNAPDDMPLVQYSSSDTRYAYNCSKKRLNFLINFLANDTEKTFEDYLSKAQNFVLKELLSYTGVNRIGIAVNYYINEDDNPPKFWSKKYDLPFAKDNTVELSYTINNQTNHNGIQYNNIIVIGNAEINGKIKPSILVDISNVAENELKTDDLDYIFQKIDSYKIFKINELLEVKENGKK